MYLNTNMSALDTIQALTSTMQQENNVIEELATGNRITSAASDPAGLAISQLMQSQISGLDQASQNAQNAVSLLQTADGALANIDSILQSMRALASEAATGTNNPTDLQDLQAEMNQYAKEITSIANTTQFNNINLLAGGFSSQSVQIGPNEGQALTLNIGAMDAYSLGVVGLQATISSGNPADVASITPGAGLSPGTTYAINVTSVSPVTDSVSSAQVSGVVQSGSIFAGASDTTYDLTVTSASTTAATIQIQGSDGFSYTTTLSLSSGSVISGSSFTFTDSVNSSQITYQFTTSGAITSGVLADISFTPATATVELQQGTQPSATTIGSPVQLSGLAALTGAITVGNTASGVGANGEVATFTFEPAAVSALATISGTGALTSGATLFTVSPNGSSATTGPNGTVTQEAIAGSGINITTQASAAEALNIIDHAIQTVNTERANIGADINRLTFAQNNANTEATNLQAANAGYLNANMPLVTSQFMQQQVLVQADVGVLAQADQLPAALLKLLP